MPIEAMIGIMIGEGVIILGLIVALVFVLIKKKQSSNKADNVKVKDGVRYTTTEDERTADGEVAVTHVQGDVILERGATYTAKRGGKIMPGKYTLLSADETEKFNIRLGGIVREYSHQTDITLAEGDETTAVSHTVILR